MTRPLRFELPDAIYHITSRGNRRDAIFVDDEDRQRFLIILAQTLDRFQASVVVCYLMDSHCHLVLHGAGCVKAMAGKREMKGRQKTRLDLFGPLFVPVLCPVLFVLQARTL